MPVPIHPMRSSLAKIAGSTPGLSALARNARSIGCPSSTTPLSPLVLRPAYRPCAPSSQFSTCTPKSQWRAPSGRKAPLRPRVIYTPVEATESSGGRHGQGRGPGQGSGPPVRRPPLQEYWHRSPNFRYTVYGFLAFGGIYYYTHLERVPYSERQRFNMISPKKEAEYARGVYESVIREYRGKFLSPHSRAAERVRRVALRLVKVSGKSFP